MHDVVGPIFLIDGGDVVVAEDEEDAIAEFEAFLVDEPVELFDALGRRLRLDVAGVVRKWWIFGVDDRKTVGVSVADEVPDAARLRGYLTEYLSRTQRPVPTESAIEDFARAAAVEITRRDDGSDDPETEDAQM